MSMSNEELIKRTLYFNGCHMVDLRIRRDGRWVDQQGDWIKYVLQELMKYRGLTYPQKHFPEILPSSQSENNEDRTNR